MRKKIEFQWEIIQEVPGASTARAKVIGGWLLHHLTISPKGMVSESMCFVADRDHEWHITKPIVEEAAQEKKKLEGFEPA